jgi:S1-C subfamily serine protease
LISGAYYFVESGTGRPLRYQETQYNENGEVIQNGDDAALLTPNGDGAIAEYEFIGTGFYVGNGYVLTNKHVAQPWFAEERLMRVASMAKGVPRLQKIYAYFPGQQEPVTLKYKLSSSTDDLAVCLIEDSAVFEKLPALPLNQSESSNLVGRKVVLMGYPNGSDRLIAMLPENEAQMTRSRCGSSIETLLKCFALKNRIQPLTTDGIITDLDQRRVVHSAVTAQGGSGAPLFGQSEEVIGVSFAVFTENTASNFAVPVRYAINLLQRAGWKPLTQEDLKQKSAITAPNPTAQNNTVGIATN